MPLSHTVVHDIDNIQTQNPVFLYQKPPVVLLDARRGLWESLLPQ